MQFVFSLNKLGKKTLEEYIHSLGITLGIRGNGSTSLSFI